MPKILEVPQTSSKVALVVIAHADDLLLFCGATTIHLINHGWQVHVVRVTDDRWDSWGLKESETMLQNSEEFRDAMATIGVASVTDFGYPTDLLGDRSEVTLRKELIDVVRKLKPYLVMTFDPDSFLHEDNEDHKLIARAMAEASWASGFDKHPGVSDSEIRPHLPIERWYFGRKVAEVTHHLPSSKYVDQLVTAIAKHKTMLINMAHQLDIQSRQIGHSLDKLIQLAKSSPKDFAQLIFANRNEEQLRIIGAERLFAVIEKFGDPL